MDPSELPVEKPEAQMNGEHFDVFDKSKTVTITLTSMENETSGVKMEFYLVGRIMPIPAGIFKEDAWLNEYAKKPKYQLIGFKTENNLTLPSGQPRVEDLGLFKNLLPETGMVGGNGPRYPVGYNYYGYVVKFYQNVKQIDTTVSEDNDDPNFMAVCVPPKSSAAKESKSKDKSKEKPTTTPDNPN